MSEVNLAVRRRDAGVDRAIAEANGVSNLAALLGISHAAVSKWRRVPALRVIEIERALGQAVTRHQLRPDLYPEAS